MHIVESLEACWQHYKQCHERHLRASQQIAFNLDPQAFMPNPKSQTKQCWYTFDPLEPPLYPPGFLLYGFRVQAFLVEGSGVLGFKGRKMAGPGFRPPPLEALEASWEDLRFFRAPLKGVKGLYKGVT